MPSLSVKQTKIRKPRTLLVTLLLGIGVVGYSFGLFLPGQESVASLRSQLRRRHFAVMQADRLLYPIQQAEQEVAEAQNLLRDVKSQMPDQNELAALFGRVHREAMDCDATVVRFEPQSIVSLETVSEAPIHMALEGSYASLAAFLHGLESLPAIIQISHLHMRRVDEESGKLRLDLTLTVFVDSNEDSG